MTPELPADVRIERPASDEIDAVADQWVALAAGQRAFGSHLAASGNRERIRQAMLRHVVADTVRVARRDGELVGFVTFDRETDSYEQDVERGLIHNLFVREADRGTGIGGALLATAEEILRDRGAEVVALEVMAANEDARRFYRRHGYDIHRLELERDVADESDSHTSTEP